MTAPLFPTALAVTTIIPAGAAALVDWRTHRVPGALVAASLVPVVIASTIGGGSPRLAAVAVGACMMALPLLVIHLLAPTAMGFGDVKLAVVLGGALGSIAPALALPALTFLGLTLAAGLTLVVAVCTGRGGVPFAPGLVAGTGAALALGALEGWNVVT